jgi:hypothetical protein
MTAPLHGMPAVSWWATGTSQLVLSLAEAGVYPNAPFTVQWLVWDGARDTPSFLGRRPGPLLREATSWGPLVEGELVARVDWPCPGCGAGFRVWYAPRLGYRLAHGGHAVGSCPGRRGAA